MNELIAQLTGSLGIGEAQARGGAGLLFKLAQDRLGGDFAAVAQKLPGVQDLIQAVPAPSGTAGGLGSMLGGLASSLGGDAGKALGHAGGLASLAGGFASLKLDASLIGKFVPLILDFVQSKHGAELAALLRKALK